MWVFGRGVADDAVLVWFVVFRGMDGVDLITDEIFDR